VNARPFRSLLVALVATTGLAACNSTPSARRVALDVIDTLDVSESVKECMRVKVEAYDQDTLEKVAEGANEDPPDPASQEALDEFEADLESCNTSS
jgi:hypothetical protein